MINDEIKQFVNKQKLGYVATISKDNTPNLSPKGTVLVWNSHSITFADIRSPNTVRNISHNPNVEINVVDPLLRRGFRFGGKAEIVNNGDTFEEILQHYKKIGIKSKINAIILVNVTKVSSITSPLYDLGYTEEEIKSKWRNHLMFF